jgi:hypothetical protein
MKISITDTSAGYSISNKPTYISRPGLRRLCEIVPLAYVESQLSASVAYLSKISFFVSVNGPACKL